MIELVSELINKCLYNARHNYADNHVFFGFSKKTVSKNMLSKYFFHFIVVINAKIEMKCITGRKISYWMKNTVEAFKKK